MISFFKKKKGFSLIEIVVAIAILVVLAAVVAPSLITHVERSRISSDLKMCGEVANSIKIASGQIEVFDELTHYAVTNNFVTYSDSSGTYGSQIKDSEYWAPDGSGLATTITFNPVKEGGKSYYDFSQGYVNDMTYGNGSTISPARVIDDCEAYAAQCYFNKMMMDDTTITAHTYNAVVKAMENRVQIKSATYANSSMTIFVKFGYTADGTLTLEYVKGSFNGTNLDADSLASLGTGTTVVETTPEGEKIPNGTQSGTTNVIIDFSGLTGGGSTDYKDKDVLSNETLDPQKFWNFCKTLSGITEINFISGGTSGSYADVSSSGNGSIIAWKEGTKVCVSATANNKKFLAANNASELFSSAKTGLTDVKKISIHMLDTSNVTNMANMFKDNANLTWVDMTGCQTSNVTNMHGMFYGCESLQNIKQPNWSTSNVSDMSYMFYNCRSLLNIDTNRFDTRKVDAMHYMFYNCGRLKTLDVSNFKTTRIQQFTSMFEGCSSLTTLDISKFETGMAHAFDNMFKDCSKLVSLNCSTWDTELATNMREMFSGCKSLTSVEMDSFNTMNVENMEKMFYSCEHLEVLQLGNFDTLKVKNILDMFEGMVRLKEITIGAKFSFLGNGSTRCMLPIPSPRYIEGASGLWKNEAGVQYEAAKIPNRVSTTYYAASQVEAAILAERGTWWRGSTPKSSITRIQIVNAYQATTYDEMFFADDKNEGGLVVYVVGPTAYLCNMGVQKAKDAFKLSSNAAGTFEGFTSLKQINGMKLMNMINVTNIDNFFNDCSSLTTIKGYESWNVQNISSAKNAFAGTKISILNVGGWQMASLTNMDSLFYNCGAGTINLSYWDVSNVTNFSNMFKDSKSLQTIILKHWSTNGSAHYTDMFSGCTALTTINTSSSFVVSDSTIDMFTGCTNIVGGQGTGYIDGKSIYAKIDNASGPGYFTSDDNYGSFSAKLYDTGTVSTAFTELTNSGPEATPWNYYNGARLLEIKLFSMPKGKEKTVTITVPAGMYIVQDSWTTTNMDITDVQFTKLTSQGTGSYTNSQTGALSFVISPYTTATTIQCLVMFDYTIWNKCAGTYNSNLGSQFLTAEPPIVVNLANETMKKIGKVKAATGIGRTTYGYSLYLNTNTSVCYKDVEFTPLSSNYLLAADQASMSHFFKSFDMKIWAEGNNSHEKAKIVRINETITNPKGTNVNTNPEDDNYIYNYHWDNLYLPSMNFARPTFILEKDKAWQEGESLIIHVEINSVSLSGQIRPTLKNTITLKLKSKDLDPSDLTLSAHGNSAPHESYYTEPGYVDVVGGFYTAYKGFQSVTNIDFEYLFDVTSTSSPIVKVYSARPVLPYGQSTTMEITLVDNNNTPYGPYSIDKQGTSNTDGIFINALSIAKSQGLSGSEYYLKRIAYTVPEIKGGLTTNYMYHASGGNSASSGGNFVGRTSGTGNSVCNIQFKYFDKGGIEQTKKITASSPTYVTNTPVFAGFIDTVRMPLGNSIRAGEQFQFDISANSCSYPYSNSQNFKNPEIYLILPEGISIDGVQIANTQTSEALPATPQITRVKAIEINDIPCYVYKIAFEEDTWYGYCYVTSNSTNQYSGQPSTVKWIRVLMSTDPAMETANISLKDSIYFKDKNGHVSVGGSYAQYCNSDPYDVDADGITSDRYGALSGTSLYMLISAAED